MSTKVTFNATKRDFIDGDKIQENGFYRLMHSPCANEIGSIYLRHGECENVMLALNDEQRTYRHCSHMDKYVKLTSVNITGE